LDLTGLLKRLVANAELIYKGRQGLQTDGQEAEGHANYDKGIAGVLQDFIDAGSAKNCEAIALAELLFMQMDLAYCPDDDDDAKTSLTRGSQDFKDAVRCLKVVQSPADYRIAEKTYPAYYKYRVKGCPWDAYQIACEGNKLRLKNILRTPGLNMKEKAVLKQRLANMPIAQDAYLELQKTALEENAYR
jgi:hypothetical protein